MHDAHDIDEATADRLLSGPSVLPAPEVADVGRFLLQLRAAATAPPAPLSEPLAAILRDGLPAPVTEPVVPRRLPARWRRLLVSTAAGLAVAGTGLTAAAAANLLPDPIERAVGSVVETLTPFTLGPSSAHAPHAPKNDTPPPGRQAPDATSAPSPGTVGAVGAAGPTGPAAGDATGPSTGTASATTTGAPSVPSRDPSPSAATAPTTTAAGSGSGGATAPTLGPGPSVPAPPTTGLPGVPAPTVPALPSTTVPLSTPATTLPPLPLR